MSFSKIKLPSWVQFSKPTINQIKHDIWLVVVVFCASFFASLQSQPNIHTAYAVAVAAAIVALKSIFTTL